MINLLLNLKKWVKSMINVNIKRLKYPEQTTVMLHSADPKLTLNHVEYWLNPLINSGVKFSILVRDMNSLKKIKSKYPHIQLLYAKSPVDVETVVNAQSNLKTVLYPSNMAKNIHLLRFIDLFHVFIGTKNSDKLSKINKSYRAYDEIWVSGQAQIDKFKEAIGDTRHLEFKIIGKPQLEHLFISDKEQSNAYLYLSDKEDFLLNLNKFISEIDNQQQYIVSKHKKLSELLRIVRTQNKNIIELKNLEDIYWLSDKIKYIICDINYIDRWLLAFDIPIFVYVSEDTNIDLLAFDIPKECLYFFSDAKALIRIMGEVHSNDILSEKRHSFLESLLGKQATIENSFLKV